MTLKERWNKYSDKPIEQWGVAGLLEWFMSEIEDNANNGIRRKFRTAMRLWLARDAEIAEKDAEINALVDDQTENHMQIAYRDDQLKDLRSRLARAEELLRDIIKHASLRHDTHEVDQGGCWVCLCEGPKAVQAAQRFLSKNEATLDRSICTCDPKYMGFATDCPMHNESEAKDG